jgi:predicted NBD/HSP70 family sugar kinase
LGPDIILIVSTSCNFTAQDRTVGFARAIDLNNFQVATTRTARDINRRIVLNLIRKHQPISRADLARRSRLQRSTVSAIAEQLIAERWVTTGAYGDLPRGRKPTFLHLNGGRAGILGVDIRPSETTIVLADLDMRFLTQESMPTNRDSGRFIVQLCERLLNLVNSYPYISVEGIGLTVPGRIELPSNRLTFAPNLEWDPVDLKKPIEEATGLPVELENAANACALAEIWSGLQTENIRDLIAVTVSEGIGVGMVLNGQLIRGTTGVAGEFGHVTIQDDGPLCKCGNRGCLEVCASNTAAVRYYAESVSAADQSGAKFQTKPNFDLILELAEQDDPHACEALNRMARSLGLGLAMMITGLAPDVIVVVGEVTRAWPRVGPIVQEVIMNRLPTKAKTRILPRPSVTQSRLRGATALVLQKHFGASHI